VLIDSITAGIPSAYVAGLDHSPPDLHRFVAAGLIYQSEPIRISMSSAASINGLAGSIG
jgi:hypothetical protein